MTELQTLQDLAQDAFKKIFSYKNIYNNCVNQIINLKVQHIKKMILNKSITHDNNVYKIIDVRGEARWYNKIDFEDSFVIIIIMLKDFPDFKNTTKKEYELLQKIYDSSSSIRDIISRNEELKFLKHNINVVKQLEYEYCIEEILNDNFIKEGLNWNGQIILQSE